MIDAFKINPLGFSILFNPRHSLIGVSPTGLTQNHDQTNRKGRKGHKGIRVLESSCVSPVQVEQLAWKPPDALYQTKGVALEQALKRGATAVFPTPRKHLVRLLLVRMLREQTF